jgi:hypothetical protein
MFDKAVVFAHLYPRLVQHGLTQAEYANTR